MDDQENSRRKCGADGKSKSVIKDKRQSLGIDP